MSLSSRIYFPPLGLFYFISLTSSWSYLEPGGTIDWSSKNNTCDKSFQSPIDIISSEATNKRFPPFHMEHYSTAADGAPIVNNGHTVEAHLIQSPAPTLSGGGLSGIYTALQFHFHWGSSDNYGSEHFLDGNSFPMEMHIVHYSQKYPNISEALTKKNGLAVLAIFFEVTNCNNTEFQCIIRKLPRIRNPGNESHLYCNLLKLLPKNVDQFYRYSGSLTTPPCSESVVWTVYPEAVKISSWQVRSI
uniref:Carbonic anhydrase n=1 Tax=Octopus bimaculoides TaxID=37653 RepID=A0A0L8I5X5_OCTBM